MNKTLWQYYVDTAATITDRALEEIDTLQQTDNPGFLRGPTSPGVPGQPVVRAW